MSIATLSVHFPVEIFSAWYLAITSESGGLCAGAAGGAVGALPGRDTPLSGRWAPSDLGISTQVRSPLFGRPTVYLYDRVQGGVGLGELVFAEHRSLLAAALEVVERCA